MESEEEANRDQKGPYILYSKVIKAIMEMTDKGWRSDVEGEKGTGNAIGMLRIISEQNLEVDELRAS